MNRPIRPFGASTIGLQFPPDREQTPAPALRAGKTAWA